MLYVVIAMLVSLVVAGLVVVYVAYPHRGERMPKASWLGDALGRAADAVPTIDESEAELFRFRETSERR